MSVSTYQQGWDARIAGKAIEDCPFDYCSEHWYRWIKGFTDTHNHEEMHPNVEAVAVIVPDNETPTE